MTKKFGAVRTKWFGIFQKSGFMDGRILVTMESSLVRANNWVADKRASGIYSADDFMIEEVKVTIPSWDGKWVPADKFKLKI